MIRIFSILIMACSFQLAFGQLHWKATVIDFGTFDEERGDVEKVFECENTGNYPIELTRVRTSCGCVALDFQPTTVEPGEKYRLPVKFNPEFRPGYFDKSIYLYSSDKLYKLNIIGNVRPSSFTSEIRFPLKKKSVRLSKEMVNFGQVKPEEVRMVKLSGCNVSEDTLSWKLLELPQNMDLEVFPDSIPSNNVFVLKFKFSPDTTKHYGFAESRVKIEMGADTLTFPVQYTLTAGSKLVDSAAPKVEVLTPKLVFDSYGNRKIICGEAKLKNAGLQNLKIFSVSSQDKAIAVKEKTVEIAPGETAILKFEINTSLVDDDILNSELLILTNDPYHPTAKVRIVGMK